jgi:glutamate synthase domain-containing protein 3
MLTICAQELAYRELNAKVRAAVAAGEREVVLSQVNGQRYLGVGLTEPVKLEIHGVAGNDLAAFMDGPLLEIWGNAQDGVGNTMNDGRVVIHGSAGDILGYGMRGGRILVRGDVGYRVGIHMKSFKHQIPAIVVGGRAGDFLGEYMAGGVLVVLNLGESEGEPAGRWLGTGMHGGVIYLRGKSAPERLGKEVSAVPLGEADQEVLFPLLDEFAATFGLNADDLRRQPFQRLTPTSHRPYGNLYAY